MRIGAAFRDVTGILSGNFVHIGAGEIDRLTSMFDDDGA
jgi:hypothetical protein